MFIQNKWASFIYKLVIAALCVVGLIFVTGVADGTFVYYVFFYYTVLCNIGCLVFYAASSIATGLSVRKGGIRGAVKFAPHFKGGVVMGMLLCMVIFFVQLAYQPFTFVALTGSIITQLVLPLMVLVDWALFDKKGRFFGSDPIVWLVIPFAYYALVLVLAQAGVWYGDPTTFYPYVFINPDIIGWSRVLINIFLLILGYGAVGYILLGADRLLGKQAKKQALEAAKRLPEVDFDEDDLDDYFDEGQAAQLYSLNEVLAQSAGRPAPAAAGAAGAPVSNFAVDEKNLGAAIAAAAAAAATSAYDKDTHASSGGADTAGPECAQPPQAEDAPPPQTEPAKAADAADDPPQAPQP